MKNSVRFLGLYLCALAAAFAQFDSGAVVGAITDNSSSAVSGASVTLRNQDTGIEAKTSSDTNGNYTFEDVKVGIYTLAVEAPGFSRAEAKDVRVSVGSRQRVDMTLQVGAVTEVVEVTSGVAALETDTSAHGQVINQQAIVELPLNGRNYSDLALLATNVHRSPYAYANPPREGSFNANGMRSTYNNFMLDGLDNNAYSTSNQGFSNQVAQPTPDAVSEFNVVTSNFSAEYGRVGGAVVNVVMRSGTNQFHVNAWEFLRNTDLNAVGFIFTRPLVFKKPTLQRNQFGAALGGPIVKNKLFFFGDYEGYRNLTRNLTFDTLPSVNDRNGILPFDVRNPSTGILYPAGTRIPIAQINPFAAKVLGDLPTPTDLSSNTVRANNWQLLQLTRDYYDKYDGKLDYQLSDRISLFGRWSQLKRNQFFQPDIPGPSGGNGNGNVRILNQALAVGTTWSITSKSLLEFRFGFTRILGGKFPPLLGGASMQDLYGIPGLPTTPDLAGGLNTQAVGGFSQFGRQSTNPQFQNPTTWDPKVNYSRVMGRHSLKIGYEWMRINTEVNDINPLYGLVQYNGQFSKPVGGTGDATTYNLADFIFGLPSTLQLSNYLVTNYRQGQQFAYVQDDFRVNSKLTLNLGLRYEFATPRWERDNNLTNFDPISLTMLKAKDGSLYDRTLVNPDYKNFGPRVGFAYSVTPKTVVRGGYGISYVHLNRLGSADELGINGPQVFLATINQSIPAGGTTPASFRTTQQGFPAGFTSPSNFVPANANVAYIPKDTRWPRVQTWFVGVQREIMRNTIVEAAYTGNKGDRLPIVGDYNQANPNAPGGTLGVAQRRPIPSFGAITWVDPVGETRYDALSIRFERRFSSGLYFLNSFTLQRTDGDSEQLLETYSGQSVANPQNIRNLAAEFGPSSFDTKYNNVTTLVYQLPFGKGRHFGNSWNPVVDAVAGGWELNTINAAASGLPVNIMYTPNAAQDVTGLTQDFRGQAIQRPNVTGTLDNSDQINHYFNGLTFTIPTADQPFGNTPRNAYRAPGTWQWDMGLNKNFRLPFREGASVQFRSEFFNILNHTNLGAPTVNVSSGAFGTIRSTLPARQIQFGLKLNF